LLLCGFVFFNPVFPMGQTNLILNLLFEGLRPSKIAAACGVTVDEVTGEIIKAIQERRVQRSQVLATLKEWENEIAVWFPMWKQKPQARSLKFIYGMLKESNLAGFDLDIEEVKLCLLCLEKSFTEGEIYEALCEIERTLHTKIRLILIENYGAEEKGWWRQGVPLDVRQYCVELREKDDNSLSDPPYNFTTLGHLLKILQHNKNPNHFKTRLPLSANGKALEIRAVCDDLIRLAKIRNTVMHPIRASPPSEAEFFFVKEMRTKLEISKWR
jgi:hypothetical protein